MSFVLDPPSLVASGAAVEPAVDGERARGRAIRATVAPFAGVSTLLYANAPGPGRLALCPAWLELGRRLVRGR